ncbi:MAG: NUDIX hydrolase [Candidatus Nanoarchaeia archaeon]
MDAKKQLIVVLGIIQNQDGKILISQRLDPKIREAHLKWDVPGGTNEFGESLKETLLREILEETGLSVNILKLLPDCVSKEWKHTDYLQHTLIFCYQCEVTEGDLQLNDPKINELKWISPIEALELDLLPTTRVFIELFLEE